mmetsp:Transcript_7904/g.12782  ORF Transcript_7904/g.12782 Transcript_7904/m.12782 type:complete len:691 (-) Transcript_7904:214-2286(-)|eukprot:CAMPEP_0203744820 /NCGR_PEP_ID=MMETSP0098-20131031/765_1 /ASSEMBLY_ACC=CAM_ASM_000208 /TAXON_ID=96639 /ORGANISM=" , Strain NY0313808BC1" /LENGTH=690 /DNA_ID=CAMNT_0050632443 /DNA_START=3136 /DNA_END=5208 /DNA_ORIENTATION=-
MQQSKPIKQSAKLQAKQLQTERYHAPEVRNNDKGVDNPETLTPAKGPLMMSKPETETPSNQSGAYKFSSFIGDTPLIEVTHLGNVKNSKTRVFAKAEFFNPGFSIKDRIVSNILGRAEREGKLKPGMTVVAASSGNTGCATAMFCAMKGYECIITTSPKCSVEKMNNIKLYGAKLLVSPSGAKEGQPTHYMNMATNLAAENPEKYFDVDQYDTLSNPEGHYLTLGPEIWEQTHGTITHFIAAGSTGGTISGVGRYLKEQDPSIRVVLGDPIGSIFTEYFNKGSYGSPGKFLVEGVGKGSIPGAMDFKLIDQVVPISDQDAFDMSHRLAQTEGILAGGSAGLNVLSALRLAATIEEPAVIVTVMPDMGMKYLSKVYSDEWLTANGLNIPAVNTNIPRRITPATSEESVASSHPEETNEAPNSASIECCQFTDLVGASPLVDLSDVVSKPNIQLFAKLECFSPGFSTHDRWVQEALDKDEQAGKLTHGMTVVTSGESGISAAMFSASRGYKCIVQLDESFTQETRDTIKAYGGEVVEQVPPMEEGTYIDLGQKQPFQESLGQEMWEETRGQITHIVSGVCVSGTMEYLHQQNESIKHMQVEAENSAIKSDADETKKTIVSQAQAIQACHQLCKSQGMCCDLASGMNFAAALKLAEQLGDEPATIVTIFPSNGLKELSTVYNPEWLEENGFSC